MTRYDEQFFANIDPGSERSARVVLPLLFNHYKPATMVDVGCGSGAWIRVATELGVGCLGIDGADTPGAVVCDLEQPIVHPTTYDLAMSLEVAEHLSPARGEGFVADLCSLAPVVLFSAAAPGQPGTGHINNRPPAYWADLFLTHGYIGSGALRSELWGDERVEWWYQANVLVFWDPERVTLDLDPRVQYIVHPELYEWSLSKTPQEIIKAAR